MTPFAERREVTCDPSIFHDVQSLAAARGVILTEEGAQSTEERWEKETPYLAELIIDKLGLHPEMLLLDYGCGIGRMAKELIRRKACRVVGCDISANMRALSFPYLGEAADRFVPCSPGMLARTAIKADAAIAVWTLQHCQPLEPNLDLIVSALKPGGELLVVNGVGRAVPIGGGLWGNDGKDVLALVAERLRLLAEGPLATPVDAAVIAHSFWALFRN